MAKIWYLDKHLKKYKKTVFGEEEIDGIVILGGGGTNHIERGTGRIMLAS